MNKHTATCIAIALLLSSTLAASWWSEERKVDHLARPLSEIPQQVSDWQAIGDQPLPESTEAVLRATSYLQRGYRKDAHAVDLFIAYYAVQRPGESLHSPKNCLPGGGWELWDYAETPIRTSLGETIVNRYSIRHGLVQKQVLYWYQFGGRVIPGEYQAKLDMVWRAIATGHTAGAIVRLVTDDTPEDREDAAQFASVLIPEVAHSFQK